MALGVSALEFRNWLGGEEKVNAYCHDLALKGGKRLAEVMGTALLDPTGDITLNMVLCSQLLHGYCSIYFPGQC